jgi:hypothetical protein
MKTVSRAPIGSTILILALSFAAACGMPGAEREAQTEGRVSSSAAPDLRHYICYRATGRIDTDGRLDESDWQAAEWSEAFVDIEGYEKPIPEWRTRFKLLWDDEFLYVGAELEEPHVWATLTQRDAVLYRENDFELFIDPDGDTHNYYELEINALGTVWDLFLAKPYRDGGKAQSEWDIAGLRAAVSVHGTVADPSDRDEGWTVELAIPWSAVTEHAPGGRAPRDGEHWRLNFSRVQWHVEEADGGYRKVVDPASGRPAPERNWVWSPQGAVNMHRPEMWGILQLSDLAAGEGAARFQPPVDEDVRWALRQVYYAQRSYYREHETYAADPVELGLDLARPGGSGHVPEITLTADGFEATAAGDGGAIWRIRQDGKIWSERTVEGER